MTHMERDTRLLDICVFLENLIKITLNKKVLRKKRLSCSPKAGPLWKQTPISEPYLTYLSGSPVKEPSSRSPSWNTSQRAAPFLEQSFTHLSKSPVYEPHPGFYVSLPPPLLKNEIIKMCGAMEVELQAVLTSTVEEKNDLQARTVLFRYLLH